MQAGVLPALADGELPGTDRWRAVGARPGQDLLAELENTGLPGAATEGVVPAAWRLLPAYLSIERLVLVVDQHDEAFVQYTPDDRLAGQPPHGGLELAQAVARHETLTVILRMRDDFFPRLAAPAPGSWRPPSPACSTCRRC